MSGGEPFLHPDISTFLSILKSKNILSKVYSSGITRISPPSSITNDELQKLVTKGLSHLVFILYSSIPETHDAITCIEGSFEATKNAIENAIKVSLDIEIHFVATDDNINDLPVLSNLVKELGITKISVLRFVPQGRGRLSGEKLIPTKTSYMKLRKIIIDLRKRMPDMTFRLGSPFNFLLLGPPTPCTTGLDRMIIDADGFAYPCDALKQIDFGKESTNNVLKNSLQHIIDEGPLFQLVSVGVRQT